MKKKPLILVIGLLGLVLLTYSLIFFYAPRKDQPVDIVIENSSESTTKESSDDVSVSESQELPATSFPILEPGLFQVIVPEKFAYPPRVSKQEITSLSSNVNAELTTYTYAPVESQDVYTISFVRYPNEIFQRKSMGVLLDNLRDGQVSDYKGVIKKESTSYDSRFMQARELEIHSTQLNKKQYIRSMLIVSQPYVFVFSLSSMIYSSMYSSKSNSYFDSIHLLHQNHQKNPIVVGN